MLAVVMDSSAVEVSFIAADGISSIGFFPDGWRSPVYPMRRWLQPESELFAIASSYSGNLVIALPLERDETANRCVVNTLREPGGWECFRFEPVEATDAAGRALVDRVARFHAAAQGDGLRSCLLSEDQWPTMEIVARLAPEHSFEHLATSLLHEPALQEAFFAAAKNDPFAVGMNNLIATQPQAPEPPRNRGWFGRQAKPAPIRTWPLDLVNDRRFAVLAAPTADGTYTSFAHKLTIVARRSRMPTRRLCVLATLRDEGPYLLDWIAYHRTLGVEHFFIYSNGNTDGSDDLLDALAQAGVITWIKNEDAVGNIQFKAWGHCLSVVPAILDYEWCAVLDGDEYISLRPGRFATIPDYIAWQEKRPVDVIVLTWNMFWSSGQRFWRNEPSIVRFTQQSHPSGLGKSVIRPRKFNFTFPHHPASNDHTLAITVRDSLGEQQTYPRGQMTSYVMTAGRYGDAWINHYFSRSAEELLWKWSRGRGDSDQIAPFADMSEDFISNFMNTFDLQQTPISDAAAARLPAVRQELGRLLMLPGVRDQQAEVVRQREIWAKRTPKVVAQLRQPGLSDAKQAFLDLLVR